MNFAGNGTGEKKIKHKSNDNLRTRGNRCFLFYAINNGQDAWQQLTMLSLGGKSDVALDEFLKNKPITEITFCLDNDDAGKHATEQLSDKYALKGYAVSKDIPLNKDFNDDLKAFRALEEKSIVQTTKPLRR